MSRAPAARPPSRFRLPSFEKELTVYAPNGLAAPPRPSYTLADCLPDTPAVSSRDRGWEGVNVDYLANYHHEDLVLPVLNEHVLALNLGQSVRLRQRQDRDRLETPNRPGDLIVLPAGSESAWGWNVPTEVLHLRVDPWYLARLAGGDGAMAPVELNSHFRTRDPLVEQLGRALLLELRFERGGRLYAESLAQALAMHLLRDYAISGTSPRTHPGGLSRSRLQQALDYVRENLERELSLKAIAAEVQMSPYHFARLFKQSMGIAPHQYVIRCRIERAKRLLHQSNLPILEVVHRVGFQSQSHFTSVFRKLTGVTPKTYRQHL